MVKGPSPAELSPEPRGAVGSIARRVPKRETPSLADDPAPELLLAVSILPASALGLPPEKG